MEVISTLFDAVIKEAFENIIKKIREGKKLSDAEVLLLVVSQMRREQEMIVQKIDDMNSKIRELKEDVDSKIEELKDDVRDLKDEIKFLRQEVMSIKSDIINILKEKL